MVFFSLSLVTMLLLCVCMFFIRRRCCFFLQAFVVFTISLIEWLLCVHWIIWFRVVGCLAFRMQPRLYFHLLHWEHRKNCQTIHYTFFPFDIRSLLSLFNAYAFLLLLFLGLHGCCELSRCKIHTLTHKGIRICDGIRRAHVLLKLSVESKVQRQRGVCVLGSHDKFGSYVAYPKYPSKPKTEKNRSLWSIEWWESFFTAVFFHVLGEIVS